MNEGIIATRYARALLKYAVETGKEDEIYAQASALVLLFQKVPRFRNVVEGNRELPVEKKLSLMETALGQRLADAIIRFAALVDSRSRMEYWSRMLASFVDMYREVRQIRTGSLITAVRHEDLRERLETAMEERLGGTVVLEDRVDGSLIGGFVLEVEGLRMDASVDGQLRRIRKELIEKDNRII